MFIGPKSLAPYAGATLAIHLLYAVSRRQLPHVPLLVLTALAMMPPAISGSFTRLFSCWLWVQSLYIPFVDHLQDDISDRDQVRLLLVGALLSGFFSIVAEAMAHYKTFRGILAINIGAAIAVLLRALPGKVVRHRVVWAAEQIVLYATRMLLILANRAAKSLMRVLGQPSGGIHGSSRNQPEEKYQYRHLIGTQIRLLRVFPGLPSEPIRCRLETVALGTAPPFEAVSYVWGSADLVRFVVIDNDGEGDDESTRLDVTDSAYSIIARRRSRWHERLLWIDGLCIDQENLDERASQVQMMGALYANARRVVAWLGPCSTAHVVQSFLAQLRYKKEGLGYSVEQLKDATADPMGPQWLALSDFFLNPWFTRMWIVQEVALSKELHLLYGDVCMDWDVVRQSLSILMGKHMMGNFPQMDGSFFSKERQRIFRGLCNVDVMLELRGDVDCSRDLTLATALECALEFECKDERDKIYALLSLMESSTLTPDYRIDFQALYVDAMWEILLQATSLDAMEFAGTGRARRAANLPSWVPDWDGGSTNGPYHVSSYSAGTDHAAAVVLDRENPLVVSVQGWERDRVELLGDALEMGGETTAGAVEDNRTLRGWYKAAECMAMECAAHYPEEGSTRLEMFVRTVLGDRISDL
ncbi:heterokaryon incompatibility protein-domain-containing protein, partial [Phialemonium atrogriseum]